MMENHGAKCLVWQELVQFKDPVYGYIGVPKVYANNLIDTAFVQRLKGVAQSGIRPLFSAANHDRFSHSLGVYKFAVMSYNSLKNAISIYLSKLRTQNKLNDSQHEELITEMEMWGNLLNIAAIIHDIGHPSGSHSFEFLYDDIFIHLDGNDELVDVTSFTGWIKQWERNENILKGYKYSNRPSYLNSGLKREMKKIILVSNRVNY